MSGVFASSSISLPHFRDTIGAVPYSRVDHFANGEERRRDAW
jgi:hypothetical protein